MIKFYSYDVHVNNYPRGIPRGDAMPEDTSGQMDDSVELKLSVLPMLFILPARQKGMPYKAYFGEATAGAIIEFIIKNGENDLSISKFKDKENVQTLGKTAADDTRFYEKLALDGIRIDNPTRSFTSGGFIFEDKSEQLIKKKTLTKP